MTVRVTLRLPEAIFERLAAASRDSGRSLNQVMVDALRGADLACGPAPDASDFEKLRWIARDHAPPWTDEDDALMLGAFGDDDPNAPVPSRDELWARMPLLRPENYASRIVIEDREDRF
jgi:hypothetical protein